MASPGLNCPAPTLAPGAQGIARVAVDDAGARLIVTFLRPIEMPRQAYLYNAASYSLSGGQRLFPRVLSAAPYAVSSPPDNLSAALSLDDAGDFSIYTLTVSGPEIDPFFSSHKLRFRLACDEHFDCRAPAPATPPAAEEPVPIDYLAKDYSSFRQALLDFLPARFPAWTERSEADIGIMLLELFSATADNLSYMQDRVASEAFLGTATQRRSVAGHLALLGYRMDEGASARTWLQFHVNTLHTLAPGSGLKVTNQPATPDEPVIVFEPLTGAVLDPNHNAMRLYAYGNSDCCVPRGATGAALEGSYDGLRPGDWLLFEDTRGHRDIVRLASGPVIAPPSSPPGAATTGIEWSPQTPLRFDYCVAETTVRGNVVEATHGETIVEPLRALTPEDKAALASEIAARKPWQRVPRQRLRLARAPLARIDGQDGSALRLQVEGFPGAWKELPSLLESGADDHVFRVEIDDRGEAAVVFGDGTFGVRPPETADVTATYRIGGGKAGNVAAGTLTVAQPPQPWLVSVSNPLAAAGGRDLESRDHARRVAPPSFHKPLVAVTTADYQAAAQAATDDAGRPLIQRAKAAFRWTGSWLTVTLAVDPRGSEALTPDMKNRLLAYLDTRRLAAYDLEIVRAVYVPLELAIEFCTRPGFRAGDVAQRLVDAFSAQRFFHPDNFSFGEALYAGRIYAAAMAVAGVESARIVRLARLHSARPDTDTAANLRQGYLAAGADEIVRLDNDRNFPENGVLSIRTRGGAA